MKLPFAVPSIIFKNDASEMCRLCNTAAIISCSESESLLLLLLLLLLSLESPSLSASFSFLLLLLLLLLLLFLLLLLSTFAGPNATISSCTTSNPDL